MNNWWKPDLYMKNAPLRRARGTVIGAIRKYFNQQGLVEVDTPTLQPAPSDEVHVKCFLTGDFYLHTSPELAMKKLLVAGEKAIFQICHAYRDEPVSDTHSPEFTMLEWYRTNTDYTAMMAETENIVKACAKQCGVKFLSFGLSKCNPFSKWERLTVAEAFEKYVGIDILKTLDKNPALFPKPDLLKKQAEQKGVWCSEKDSWEDIFFRIMMEKIEPSLGHKVPTILYDYPTCLGAMARRKPTDEKVCERFEAYICGVELCNAFSELTDVVEQRRRFETDQKTKQDLYGYTYPIDEDFMDALKYGMPETSGNALGIDRLIMLISGTNDIQNTCFVPVL